MLGFPTKEGKATPTFAIFGTGGSASSDFKCEGQAPGPVCIISAKEDQ